MCNPVSNYDLRLPAKAMDVYNSRNAGSSRSGRFYFFEVSA